MLSASINLLFPINQIFDWFFIMKTKRKPTEFGVNQLNEALLFTTVVLWIQDWQRFTLFDKANDYSIEGESSSNKNLILNIIYEKNKNKICEALKKGQLEDVFKYPFKKNTLGLTDGDFSEWQNNPNVECPTSYPFTWILALTALNIWVKFLLRMKITKQFGPMFKVIIKMTIDLAEFMILWILVMMTFTCVSCLIFNQVEYMTFAQAFIFYFEASLGSWDVKKFCTDE